MKVKSKVWATAAASAAAIFVVSVFALTSLSVPASEVDKSSISTPKTTEILLIANENVLKIAPDNALHPGGVLYDAMTFNGTIPGPPIFVDQGDIVKITLRNDGRITHSLNFHAGFGPNQALSGVVLPGEIKTWSFNADYAGAFLYHCDGDNLNGIWEHLSDGMYGGIVVRPADQQTAKEFYIVFGEVYNSEDKGLFVGTEGKTGSFDIDKFMDNKPDLILTNGEAYRYIPWIGSVSKITLNPEAEVFHSTAGELTRWYIFNAGPRHAMSFNFGAGMVEEVDSDFLPGNNDDNTASSARKARYDEMIDIPPGSGSVVETTFPEKGTYFGNDHDVGSLLMGAGFVVEVSESSSTRG